VARKNIKLPADEYDKHNERRKQLGQTWSEYIDGQTPDIMTMLREAVRAELERFAQERKE